MLIYFQLGWKVKKQQKNVIKQWYEELVMCICFFEPRKL